MYNKNTINYIKGELKLDNSTEYEKSVLIDGIDELETTEVLQNNIKHLQAGNVDYRRDYRTNELGQGTIAIDKYIDDELDNNYHKSFTFVRNPDEKSDFFNIDRLTEINVKEPVNNINKNLATNQLDHEQVGILNNIFMIEEQSTEEVMLKQYNDLSDSKAIMKLVKENEREKVGDNNFSSASINKSNGSREFNVSQNNEITKDTTTTVNHEEENNLSNMRRYNSRQNEIREEDEASRSKKHENKIIDPQYTNNENMDEKIFKSYGLRNRTLYVNNTLGINIEGSNKDMERLESNLGNVGKANQEYNEYEHTLKEYDKKNNYHIKGASINDTDIKKLQQYNQLGEDSNRKFYKNHVPNIYRKLSKDYQAEQPSKPLLIDFNTFNNTAINRVNAQYENMLDTNIDKKLFENSLVKEIQRRGTFIDEKGDRFMSNIKDTSIENLITLQNIPLQSIQLDKEKDDKKDKQKGKSKDNGEGLADVLNNNIQMEKK